MEEESITSKVETSEDNFERQQTFNYNHSDHFNCFTNVHPSGVPHYMHKLPLVDKLDSVSRNSEEDQLMED